MGDDSYFEYRKEVDSDFIRLVIPSIGMDRNIYYLNSELNNVDYSIELLKTSNISKDVFFIAGHSGTGDNCYFNRVKELVIGDYIYIYFENKSLVYEIVEVYNIVKSGIMEINEEENVLYLITCDVYNDSRQLIVKSKLV